MLEGPLQLFADIAFVSVIHMGKRSLHLDHLVLTNIVCYSLIPWESTSNACLIKI